MELQTSLNPEADENLMSAAPVPARSERAPALAAEQSSDDIRGNKPMALAAPRGLAARNTVLDLRGNVIARLVDVLRPFTRVAHVQRLC